MSETTMPAAEAEAVVADQSTENVEIDERNSYELAFHVLPTVAEGEVATVFDSIKAEITKTEAEIFDEEAPERFDLAYEVVKHYEGKNRKFTSAYFGWVRFKSEAEAVAHITEAMEENTSILRYLLIKLTKVEEENPFRFHDALDKGKTVTEVAEVPVVETSIPEVAENKTEPEENAGEADDTEIDEALEKTEV